MKKVEISNKSRRTPDELIVILFYRSFGLIHFAFDVVVCVGSRSTPFFDT